MSRWWLVSAGGRRRTPALLSKLNYNIIHRPINHQKNLCYGVYMHLYLDIPVAGVRMQIAIQYFNHNYQFLPMIITKLFTGNPLFYSLSACFAVVKGPIPRRFQNRQKPREHLFTNQQKKLEYNPLQAIALMRLHAFTSFEESVEICVRLNVNPKNGEQVVRGTANLPAGLGKTTSIAVFCNNDEYEELKKQGLEIDVHIKDTNAKELEKMELSFEKLFTTPAHIAKLKAFGKLLGPKGLMPNAKLGTLVTLEQLPLALKQAKAGQVSFRVDNGKNIHTQIGKMGFSDEQLLENWRAVMKSLVDKRPPTLKGKYFTDAYLKSTMGPSWRINLVDIDPRTDKSIWGLLDESKGEKRAEQSM